MKTILILCALFTLVSPASSSSPLESDPSDEKVATEPSQDIPPYGVDVSFPMHHALIKNDEYPIGQGKQEFYEEFMAGCRNKYSSRGGQLCDDNEAERIEMNMNQPKAMKNFTEAGYAKLLAPKVLRKMLDKHFVQHFGKQRVESWPKGNTYVNHWEGDSFMLDMPRKMRERISEIARVIIEAWTGQKLIETSLYGIRIYNRGAVLAPHVDRLPLVSSCIINVAQDVEESWPLEVIGHDGYARNITMEPGEMILYESHSVIHGRPFPLKGKYFANVFVHFEPYGYTGARAAEGAWGTDVEEETEKLYEEAMSIHASEDGLGEIDDVPSYVSPEVVHQWKQNYVYEEEPQQMSVQIPKLKKREPEGMSAHTAAALGKLNILKQIKERDPSLLTKADENGWKPLHEAARSGHVDVLEFLVENGGNVNERTNKGKGGTPLWWATQMLSPNHPAVEFLKSKGAKKIAPQDP